MNDNNKEAARASSPSDLLDSRRCPCTIADEPCRPDCTCVKPHTSHGCFCCAAYGSAEQRRAAANAIVKICRRAAGLITGDDVLRFGNHAH